MTQKSIKKLHRRAARLLKKLVTARGIYASTDNGWRGAFHSLFGRDSAITAQLVFSAEDLRGKRKKLSKKAYHGLLFLRKWQGQKDNPASGEERGKMALEIRTGRSRNAQTLRRLSKYRALWFLDPKDHLLKSWDSADGTPLWIIGVARWHAMKSIAYRSDVLDSVRLGLEWCLGNLKQYGGFAGFTGADLKPERVAEGLHNQSWKDNEGAYQYPDGAFAKHPIKDVFVNALFWAALNHGSDIFKQSDPEFATELALAAKKLKKHFNDPRMGFLMYEGGTRPYFAEALDGDGKQLRAISADAGMCLWANYRGECIIDDQYVEEVVRRLMMPDMLDRDAGMRNYSSSTVVKTLFAGGYHRGQNTYWPFVSGLIVSGFDKFGFRKEAKGVAEAALKGAGRFRGCIELFQGDDQGGYHPWHHPAEKQQSATEQAWSAAAIYYMSSYFLEK
jgi:glycogen debranching enzyme